MQILRRRERCRSDRGVARYLATAALAAAAGSALVVPQRAEANGRYPEANQLVVGPSNPDRILVRVTFGMVVSQNGGADWRWVCEQSIGFNDVFDPAVALLQGEVILAGLQLQLSQSTDFGCGFSPAQPDLLGNRYVIDVTAERAAPQNGWAVTTDGPDGAHDTQVFFTTNAGASWASAGPALDPNFRAVTIDVAPSNPSRVYVSGLMGTTYEPVIAVSDDAGQSWTLQQDLGIDGAPYIGAIDPNDEDRVYVRAPGNDIDTLYVSTDGAVSFQQIIERPGRMLGLALSGDGSRIAIGGPSFGIESADAFDLQFTKRSDASARCLTFHASGLFVCGDEATDGYTVGSSTDEGATITPIFNVAELLPLECEPTASVCRDYWPGTQSLLGLDPATVAGATTATTSSGGGTDETGDGCGCETGGPQTRTPWWGALLAVAAMRLVSGRGRGRGHGRDRDRDRGRGRSDRPPFA